MAIRMEKFDDSTVSVSDDGVLFDRFIEVDNEVVTLAREAEDVERLMHGLLQIGARAHNVANVSLDAMLVDEAFTEMRERFDGALERTIERVNATAEGLLDGETGALPAALSAWRSEFERLLDDAFDADSRKSLIAKMDGCLGAAKEGIVDAVRQTVSIEEPDSPWRLLGVEVERTVKEQADVIRRALADLSERLVAEQSHAEGAAEVFSITAAKGLTFEDRIHRTVGETVAAFGDVASRVGNETGSTGAKVGDEVVEVNPEDTRGQPARYVIEAKDRSGIGLRKMLEELDAAMANRDALAAVGVFARPDIAPIKVPFQDFGDRCVVVLDGDRDDNLVLRLAAAWARGVVRRKLAEHAGTVDVTRIESLIGEARRALQRWTTVKRGHSSARKAIDQASEQVAGLVADVERVLDDLCEEIAK